MKLACYEMTDDIREKLLLNRLTRIGGREQAVKSIEEAKAAGDDAMDALYFAKGNV